VFLVVGVLGGIQTLWGFWSDEPLIPVLARIFTAELEWQKALAISISVIVMAVGFVLLILVYRQTKKPKGTPKLLQLLQSMKQQQKTAYPPNVQSKTDKEL